MSNSTADGRRRAILFQLLSWANAIAWSAVLVWTAGLPLMDLKKLAADEPMSWQVTGMPELRPVGNDPEPRLALRQDDDVRSVYRCDLPGWRQATCVSAGTLPAGQARVDYVDMPEGTGSPAHRMPLRVVVGNEVVFSRPYEEAISAARNRCLQVAAVGVVLWLTLNLALSALWKRGQKARA